VNFKSTRGSSWVALWLGSIFFLILLVLAGCGASNPYPVGSYERGVFFSENEKYPEAVSALETFVRHNPTDSLASEAQYLKAMAYMDMEEYPLAVVEFQILAKDFPTSDRIEDALFSESLAYFKQVGRVERDITGAYEARLSLLKFSQTYPQSKHMDEVISTMQDISDLVVQKRLAQVHVFRQLKKHDAVVIILGEVLRDEANSRLLDELASRWKMKTPPGKCSNV
jgi:outer membrane assembly lipoprotein YfiO